MIGMPYISATEENHTFGSKLVIKVITLKTGQKCVKKVG